MALASARLLSKAAPAIELEADRRKLARNIVLSSLVPELLIVLATLAMGPDIESAAPVRLGNAETTGPAPAQSVANWHLFGSSTAPIDLAQLAQAAQSAPQMDDKAIRRLEGIINSMTPLERARPELLKATRKRRIAAGAGVSVFGLGSSLYKSGLAAADVAARARAAVAAYDQVFNRPVA